MAPERGEADEQALKGRLREWLRGWDVARFSTKPDEAVH